MKETKKEPKYSLKVGDTTKDRTAPLPMAPFVLEIVDKVKGGKMIQAIIKGCKKRELIAYMRRSTGARGKIHPCDFWYNIYS